MLIHYKALSLCAAVAMTTVTVLAASPAVARSKPVVVTAQRTSDLPTQRVSFADLNLAAAQDQKALDRRVGAAVKQVCVASGHTIEQNLKARASFAGCSDSAWNEARPQIVAAIDRAQALALNGNGAVAVGSLAITISAPSGN